MRSPLVIVSAVVGALLLASCTGSPNENSSSPSSPSTTSTSISPSPSPSPSASADASVEDTAAPASIIIGLEATDIVDASGTVLLSIDYGTDGDQAVAQVTELLGSPTNTENVPKNPHYFETDITVWDGFEIGVLRPSESAAPKTSFYVEATAASTSGVTIAALDGTQVGDSFDDALVGVPEFQIYSDPNYPPRAVAIEVNPDEQAGTVAYGLIVDESPEGGVIAVIKAPDYVYDAA